jgi:methylglutaconyl-CoA hydratase
MVIVEEPILIHQSIESSIVLVTLNRPQKRNALNIPLLHAFCALFEKLREDSSLRVIILQGTGPIFCAGLDLLEASQREHEKESSSLLAKVLPLIYQMPQITIAAVHGAAFGGGAGLACAFDYAIAAEGTLFGFPEVMRGLVAAQVNALLRRQLNERHIRELLLFGESFGADKAREIGLINCVVSKEKLLQNAIQAAKKALKGAPGAIHQTKILIEALSTRSIEDDLDLAMDFHQAARQSAEAKEGISSFLEKRQPSWTQSN